MKKTLIHIGLLFVLPLVSMGQGLCDSDAAIPDGFSLPATVGCSPFNVKPTNLTNWTDVKYIFDYRGEEADQLPSLNPQEEDVFFTGPNGEPRSYSILQFGKDANGTEKYSCQVVAVRENNEPKFSYTVCNGNDVTVNIPEDVSNNFDYYEIDWGNGDVQTVNPAQLSFERRRSLNTPTSIRIEGFYKTPVSGCSRPGSISIPRFNRSQFPEGFDKPFHPNIGKLEIINDSEAELTFTGNQSETGYDLNIRERGALLPQTILSGVKPGLHKVVIPNREKSYCFHVIGRISCGVEMSAEICTNPIVELTQSELQNEISWDVVKLNQFFFPNQPQFGRNQNTSLSLIISEDGVDLSPQILPSNTNSYQHDIDCQKQYCYQIATDIEGQLFYHKFSGQSLSQKICVDRSELEIPALTTLTSSFVNNAEKLISFTDNSSWNLNREKYYLYSTEENQPLDSIASNLDSFNTLTDQECFTVAFKDECGELSAKSPEVCVVNLFSNDDVSLEWTPNSPFSSESISSYEILALNEADHSFEFFTDRSNAFQDLEPDLEKFVNEAQFKVRIIGSEGGESFTNALNLPLEFQVFVPDAFSPNNDGKNDFLELKGSLARASELNLQIFDRWGALLFEGKDKDMIWEPTTNISNGKYVYKVSAILFDGSSYQKQGQIRILR